MTIDIEPCPWCGDRPDAESDANFRLTDGMKYGSLQCCVIGPEVRTDYKPVAHWKAKAIEAWNDRRASAPPATLPVPAEQMPIAWATFTEDGSPRIWFGDEESALRWAGDDFTLTPLFTNAPAKALQEGSEQPQGLAPPPDAAPAGQLCAAARYQFVRALYGAQYRIIPGLIHMAETPEQFDAAVDQMLAAADDACDLCNGMGMLDGLGSVYPHCNGEGKDPILSDPRAAYAPVEQTTPIAASADTNNEKGQA